MPEVGSFDAKTNLPKLLDRVSKGEEFVITRRGVAVAKLVPFSAEADLVDRRRKLIARMNERRRSRKVPSTTLAEVHEWRREGQR